MYKSGQECIVDGVTYTVVGPAEAYHVMSPDQQDYIFTVDQLDAGQEEVAEPAEHGAEMEMETEMPMDLKSVKPADKAAVMAQLKKAAFGG
jgi:hypothetical protein